MNNRIFCMSSACALALLSLALWQQPAFATDVVTETYAGTSTTILGEPQLTLLSQGTVHPVEYAGTITSAQGAALTDTNSPWTNGQFGTNGTIAYAEFNNGSMVDINDTVAATNTLLLAGSLSGIASVGDAYRIRAHSTISTLFGTNNQAGLVPGPNPAQADNVLLWVPQTQSLLTLFYYSNSASTTFEGWVRADTFSPDTNEVILPQQGLMVRRIITNSTSLFQAGPIKSTATVASVLPGYDLLGTLKSSTSVTLSNLNLYTGNLSTGVAGGLNPSLSDNLLVVSPDGSVTTYFYYNNDTNVYQGWLNATAFSVANDIPIPPGSAFFLNRQLGSAFNWSIPGE